MYGLDFYVFFVYSLLAEQCQQSKLLTSTSTCSPVAEARPKLVRGCT